MANSDTQLPVSPVVLSSEDKKPLASLGAGGSTHRDGDDTLANAGADPDSPTKSPSTKWKREVLSPLPKKSSPLPKKSPRNMDSASSSSNAAAKAAKRIKTRNDSRAANDLMVCFQSRQDHQGSDTTSEVKPSSTADPPETTSGTGSMRPEK